MGRWEPRRQQRWTGLSLPFIPGITRRCLPQRMEIAFPGSGWKSRSLPAPEETHITLLLWLNYCSSLLKRQNITHLKRPSFHSAPDTGCKSPVGGSETTEWNVPGKKKPEDASPVVSPISDYFVLASGSNRNQVQAMADSVVEKMHKSGFSLKQIEGYDSANWILMDFVDIVVHVFDRESRNFYDLERIWKDGKLVEL